MVLGCPNFLPPGISLGGGTPYMREIGTTWQIGVLTAWGKPCTFWSKMGQFRRFGTTKIRWDFSLFRRKMVLFFHFSWCLQKEVFSIGIHSINGLPCGYGWKPKKPVKMANMCTVSRLERQFAILYLFHAPTGDPLEKLVFRGFLQWGPSPVSNLGRSGVSKRKEGKKTPPHSFTHKGLGRGCSRFWGPKNCN